MPACRSIVFVEVCVTACTMIHGYLHAVRLNNLCQKSLGNIIYMYMTSTDLMFIEKVRGVEDPS